MEDHDLREYLKAKESYFYKSRASNQAAIFSAPIIWLIRDYLQHYFACEVLSEEQFHQGIDIFLESKEENLILWRNELIYQIKLRSVLNVYEFGLNFFAAPFAHSGRLLHDFVDSLSQADKFLFLVLDKCFQLKLGKDVLAYYFLMTGRMGYGAPVMDYSLMNVNTYQNADTKNQVLSTTISFFKERPDLVEFIYDRKSTLEKFALSFEEFSRQSSRI